jgi:glutathione S-transferase
VYSRGPRWRPVARRIIEEEDMPQVPEIRLFELGPTRSARVRWILLEAGLNFESVGNSVAVFEDAALSAVHPLGKLPAAIIDGRPLFESAAIVTAIADLVPEQRLIASPGTWSRNLHYQWTLFALTEVEPWLHSTEINSIDFVIPEDERVPDIIPQNRLLAGRALAALDGVLGRADFLVDDCFSATDIIVGYTVNWADEQGLLASCSNLRAYQERLFAREHCTLTRHG